MNVQISQTKRCSFILIVAIFLFAGCQYDAYYDSYTRTKPNPADLTGTYVLTKQTLNEQPITALRADNGATTSIPTLIIRSNGTFVAVNIPQWADGEVPDWSIKSFKSGSGKWVLHGGSTGGYGLSFDSTNINLPNINEQGTFLVGERPPYQILFNLARDPDFDDVMIFEKETS